MSAGLVWRTLASRVGFKMGCCRPGSPSRAAQGLGRWGAPDWGTLDTDPKGGDPQRAWDLRGRWPHAASSLAGWGGLGAFYTNAGRPRWGRCHWRPGDLLLRCSGREPAPGVEAGATGRRPRAKPGGPYGEGTVRARGSTSVCAPGPPPWGSSPVGGSPVGPPGLLHADRDPSASRPPATSPRVRLARGPAPPSSCSRPVSAHAGIAPHTVPVCLSEAGTGAHTPS